MDTKDVSGEGQIVALLEQLQRNVNQNKYRKGQLVRNHPPPDYLISSFLVKLRASSVRAQPGPHNIATSQLPPAYAPCERAVKELQPIMIIEMKLETHHRGRRTVVRVCTPPDRMTAIMAIVEDEHGTAVLLQLYHQPDESVVPANRILRLDGVYILKEPFFKCATDGSYTLRVDHVGDIVELEHNDDRIPSKWRKASLMPPRSSENIRLEGNEAVKNQDWAKALTLYTLAIKIAETKEERQLAYCNRSLVNLNLGRPEQAFSDAKLGTDAELPQEKALFRQARALYEQGNFEECLQTGQALLELHPNNTAASSEMARCRARIHEKQTGRYDFHKMYKQAKNTPPLIDCATFSAPVEVRKSPGCGRGLFTTVPVVAGQLLVCEKAFAYSYADGDHPNGLSILMDVAKKRAVMGGQARLLTQLIQKLYHSERALEAYSTLHRGSFEMPAVKEVDGNLVVDSFLVEEIRSLNAFGAPRMSRESFLGRMKPNARTGGDTDPRHTTCGIWLLASRINHSCIVNCRRSFIGDMQIIRATRDLDADTELFFGYRSPKDSEPYEEVQKGLARWGFTCTCELCQSKKETSQTVLRRREDLHRKLKKAMDGPVIKDYSQAERLLKQLEQTYSFKAPTVCLGLWDPYFALGSALLSKHKPINAVRMIILGLKTTGFGITASLPQWSDKTPGLSVTRFGLVTEYTPWAFYQLFMAYKMLAPELCEVAKRYAGITYSIIVGEEETLTEEFPQLA